MLLLPAGLHAQFEYMTTNGTVTITGYTGSDDVVIVPGILAGLPVTSIGDWAFSYAGIVNVQIPDSVAGVGGYAFAYCHNLTNIMIGSSVSDIGVGAFLYCSALTSIAVSPGNSNFSSIEGALLNQDGTVLIRYPEGKGGSCTIPDSVISIGYAAFVNCTLLTEITIPESVTTIDYAAFATCTGLSSMTIPDSVTSIGVHAFDYCRGLTTVTIGDSVTNIGDLAFIYCDNLTGIFFRGNAPSLVGPSIFLDASNVTAYYLPGTTGWDTALAERPTALWLPSARINDDEFGMRTNQFGFSIIWASGKTVVVEAATNLANPDWQPVQTNTLPSGSAHFNDHQSTNYASRFYRIREL